jgi:DHA2 family multidrug resistance protein-like MFS transporter
MLLIGAAVFGLASIGAAMAGSPGSLIICRGLIGVGAAMVAPSTLSLIEAVSWRAVFAVTPPGMLALLVLGRFLLPEYRSETFRRIDGLGVAMAIGGLLSTVYAIKQFSAQVDLVIPGLVGVVGVALLVGFFRRQRRVPDPVLDLDLFRLRAYTVPQIGNALAFAVLYGTQLLIGQYLQAVLGLSPLQAGLWTIPSTAAYAVGGLIAPRLGSRLGTGRLLAAGLAASALGFGMLAAIGTTSGLMVFVLGSVVYSIGLAPVYQATTESAVAAVPADRAGVAGATLETITNLGGALGIALFGSLAGAVYRAGTVGTGIGTQTIGDAVAQAARLTPPQAADFLATAQAAFVHGFRLVAILGGVLLLVAAVSTPPLLRGPRRRAAGSDQPAAPQQHGRAPGEAESLQHRADHLGHLVAEQGQTDHVQRRPEQNAQRRPDRNRPTAQQPDREDQGADQVSGHEEQEDPGRPGVGLTGVDHCGEVGQRSAALSHGQDGEVVRQDPEVADVAGNHQ